MILGIISNPLQEATEIFDKEIKEYSKPSPSAEAAAEIDLEADEVLEAEEGVMELKQIDRLELELGFSRTQVDLMRNIYDIYDPAQQVLALETLRNSFSPSSQKSLAKVIIYAGLELACSLSG